MKIEECEEENGKCGEGAKGSGVSILKPELTLGFSQPLAGPADHRSPVVKYKMGQENGAGHRLWRGTNLTYGDQS